VVRFAIHPCNKLQGILAKPNKIELPMAYHNSTLEVRCSIFDVYFLGQF
jgi:hypothetical protein